MAIFAIAREDRRCCHVHAETTHVVTVFSSAVPRVVKGFGCVHRHSTGAGAWEEASGAGKTYQPGCCSALCCNARWSEAATSLVQQWLHSLGGEIRPAIMCPPAPVEFTR